VDSAAGRPAARHGLQLWIALPAQDRFTEPRFAHHADLPVVREDGAKVTVVVGEHRGERSPAEVFTPLVGLEVAVPGGGDFVLPVREDFEYGVVAVDGSAVVAGALVAPGLLAHLPVGVPEIRFSPAGGRTHARFFVLGGVPFGERLLMWWNFVARTGEEIAQAREDWAAGRFGEVHGYPADRWPPRRCRRSPSNPADAGRNQLRRSLQSHSRIRCRNGSLSNQPCMHMPVSPGSRQSPGQLPQQCRQWRSARMRPS
jgi:hypothetical protein